MNMIYKRIFLTLAILVLLLGNGCTSLCPNCRKEEKQAKLKLIKDEKRHQKYLQILREPVTLKYKDKLLDEIVDDIIDKTNLTCIMLVSQDEIGPITFSCEEVPLSQALEGILEPLDLRYEIMDYPYRLITISSKNDRKYQKDQPVELKAEKRQDKENQIRNERRYQRRAQEIEKPVTLTYENKLLEYIIGDIAEQNEMNFVLESYPPKVTPKPITFSCNSIPLSQALKELLEPLGLQYKVTDEGIKGIIRIGPSEK